ncbi:MAG: preprotein translocase subunit SecE [Planctomycetes bacterium]|nr:preprotein translocase subunit SecE [Planctomycetota bacterium]MCB9905716.1 preprotein translocase subunit SecE [Planctomycetota bacterium]
MAYKPQQGRIARTAAFWSSVMLLLYACYTLHSELSGRVESLAEPLGGIVIPIVSVKLSISFLISFVTFVAGFVGLSIWLNKPKSADLLIDTEAELRKVTWPTMQEATNASMVVIATVVFLMIYMGLCDRLLGAVVGRYVLGMAG